MKETLAPCDNAVMLCRKMNIVKDHMKLSEREALSLLELAMSDMATRLEEAKRIYREQRQEIDKLKQPQLWRFDSPKSVSPDFKTEYLRRLNAGDVNIEESPGILKPLRLVLEKSRV